jgi:hypothetical protein
MVISEHEFVVIKDDLFDCFMSACGAAEAPNQKLPEARGYLKERGIRWLHPLRSVPAYRLRHQN